MGVKIDAEDILGILDGLISSYIRQAVTHKEKRALGLYDKRTCSDQWLKDSELISEMNVLALKKAKYRIASLIEDNSYRRPEERE